MAGRSDIGLGFYILDERHQVIPATLEEWSASMEDVDGRRVGVDKVGGVTVSTVFLGIDHGLAGRLEIFETKTFGGKADQVLIARYATWEAAERGHRVTVTRLKAGYTPR